MIQNVSTENREERSSHKRQTDFCFKNKVSTSYIFLLLRDQKKRYWCSQVKYISVSFMATHRFSSSIFAKRLLITKMELKTSSCFPWFFFYTICSDLDLYLIHLAFYFDMVKSVYKIIEAGRLKRKQNHFWPRTKI